MYVYLEFCDVLYFILIEIRFGQFGHYPLGINLKQ